MLLPLLLALAAQAQTTPPPVEAPRDRRQIHSLIDTADPDDDPLSLGLVSRTPFGGNPFSITIVSPISLGWTLGARPNTLEIVLTSLGSGFDESFYLQLPLKIGAKKRPLLMVFHKFGSKANDPYLHTKFPLECSKRNWFMLSSLGASKKSFSSLPSQENRDDVLDWVMALYSNQIDTDRIYGVGFSMGGGSVTNWAARHLDPAKLRMAALVDHTGGVALEDTWKNEVSAIHDIMKIWFGGPPGQFPFEYQRSSVLSFKPGTMVGHRLKSLGSNLVDVPMKLVNADQDPLTYLVAQTKAFRDFLVPLGATVVYEEVNSTVHDWATLDAKAACDFLSAFTLTTPLAADSLADRDGRWHWFDLSQDVTGAFTPVSWSIETASNKLELSNTANLKRIGIDLDEAPLSAALPLTVEMESADFLADIVDLTGYVNPPSAVLRDGLPTLAWTWDAGAQRVTLLETDPQEHVWQITP